MKRLLPFLLLLFCFTPKAAHAAITEVTAAECTASAATCTPGTTQRGDLGVSFAYDSSAATAPSAGTGWNTLSTACGTGNTNGCRVSCSVASSTTFSNTPSFTNATRIIVLVFRGANTNLTGDCNLTAIGTMAANGNTGTSITFSALSPLQAVDSTSWVVGFAGHRTASNLNAVNPTGMTEVQSVGSGPMAAAYNTQGGVATWTSQSETVNASSGWRAYTFEVKAMAPITAAVVQRWGSTDSDSGTQRSVMQANLPNGTLSGNALLGTVSWGDATSVVGTFSDENGDTPTVAATIDANSYTTKLVCFMPTAGTLHPKVTFSGGVGTVVNIQMSWVEYKGITNCTTDGTTTASGLSSNPLSAGSFTPGHSGDVIYLSAVDTNPAPPANWSAGPSPMALMSVDQNPGDQGTTTGASELMVQASAAAINPSIYCGVPAANCPGNVNIAAAAFQISATGTAPTVLPRVVAVQASYDGTGNAAVTTQLPIITGDTVMWGSMNSPTCTTPSISDYNGNTWTQRGTALNNGGSGTVQHFDSIAAVGGENYRVSSAACNNTGGGASNHEVIEVTGVTAYATQGSTTGTMSSGTSYVGVAVTPTVNPSVIIYEEAHASSNATGISSNGNFLCGLPTPFAATNDAICDNNGFGSYATTSTSSTAPTWTTTAAVGAWAGKSSAYSGTAASLAPIANKRKKLEKLDILEPQLN